MVEPVRARLLTLATMIVAAMLYQFFIWPVVSDALSDWAFLHAARVLDIQRAQQQQRAAPPQGQKP